MLKKSILLISCHNFCCFSLVAKVLSLLSILVFQSNIIPCKNFFFLYFSIALWRLFDDQNFIVQFVFSLFGKSWKYAEDLFACFVDLEKVYNCLSNFGEFCNCKKMLLMVNCYMSLGDFMSRLKFCD